MIEFSYTPKVEWVVAAGAAVAVFLWASYYRAKGKPGGFLKWLLVGLRLLSIAAVVICLLDPQWVEMNRHEQKSRLAVLLDTSKSMSISDLGTTRLEVAKDWVTTKLEPLAPPGKIGRASCRERV